VANNFPGWQSRIAEEAGAGVILPSDDLPAAARRIADALRDRDWLHSAGAAARRLAETRFNRDDLALQLEKVLQQAHADGP
jgi:glycosyltransferase involved in cell wall biosynthesis